MRKLLSTALVFAVLATALINLSSCEKDEGKLPNIAFKTGVGYTHADGTIASGGAFLVGIDASKSEGEDVLKTFNISKSVNGAAATSVSTTTIPTAQEDSYSADFPLLSGTGTAGTTEKWSFTVTNRDGLTNTVSFTLTFN